jgi:hypothetical protein
MHDARLKHASDTSVFFRSLAGFAIAVLVMVGVAGTLYKLVAPDGWLARLFGGSVTGGLAASLGFLAVGFCVWLTRGWVSLNSRNRYAALPVYVFAGAGAVYALQALMAR